MRRKPAGLVGSATLAPTFPDDPDLAAARELIDRVAAGAPVRQLLLVEPLGHARVPFAGVRPDHSTSTV